MATENIHFQNHIFIMTKKAQHVIGCDRQITEIVLKCNPFSLD